jgi:putative serine protease PepD
VWAAASNSDGNAFFIITAYGPISAALKGGGATLSVQALQTESPTIPAVVLAKDPTRELVVLRVAAPAAAAALRPISVARSSSLRVGQDLLLVGAGDGDGGGALTAGVLSATGRTVPATNGQAMGGMLQTDAVLGHFSLGGALVDSSGAVVGMPTLLYGAAAAGGVGSRVGFAVSADVLRDVVPKLIVYGNAMGRT